jgi:signal transduction histidine kinase
MRTDRGWRRFYATGWLVSAAVGVVAFCEWHAYVREVESRAEEAERTRDEMARRRAVEERLRIARELHDSLTHSISVIKVQAGVAAHLARKNGEQPSDALIAIEEASNDAVRELRSTLDVLRREDDLHGSGLDLLPHWWSGPALPGCRRPAPCAGSSVRCRRRSTRRRTASSRRR